MIRKHLGWLGTAALACGLAVMAPSRALAGDHDGDHFQTSTPVKHVVVIFQENVSFDHYFGTYPDAAPNKDGSIYFRFAQNNTPRVNNLETSGLLTNNPNGVSPFRIDRSVPNTCDQDHNYGDEQLFFHGGLMDQFLLKSCNDPVLGKTSTMGYYDGNTVTAIWNYAQHFAMSDNFFGTTFGPSTPGALNVIAGTTYSGTVTNGLSGKGFIANAASSGAVIGDADPAGDNCSNPKRTQITMSGKNVGDLLNEAGITWGSFMGGFANCAASHTGITGLTTTDYIPHHAWFQYFQSTLNANHVGPSSDAMIGKSDQANHEYDLSKFFVALQNHNLPAVSYVKAIAIEDGHAGYSDPIDEQFFLVNTINAIIQAGYWKDTAIIITYDDSDGWYDHQMAPIVNQSNVADDQLLGPGNCGTPKPIDAEGDIQNGRCGFGPRLPLLAVSPYARSNYVDHRVTDFSSVVRFIEDNWNLGRIGNGSADATAGKLDGLFDFDGHDSGFRGLILDPSTGVVIPQGDN
ncbi:MAG TPA: alkaline phosphatase family protein [Candidatus Acidoferrales bacterium]|nr:alkaline phosphatase family protein [Candidatus Acidoferrales bacterium]